MANEYQTCQCMQCNNSAFPMETYPYGTCSKKAKVITRKIKEVCNTFERKETQYGKNK